MLTKKFKTKCLEYERISFDILCLLEKVNKSSFPYRKRLVNYAYNKAYQEADRLTSKLIVVEQQLYKLSTGKFDK